MANPQEGLTLRIYLTSEKEQYTKVNCIILMIFMVMTNKKNTERSNYFFLYLINM
jgi:hypothetical protein